MAQRSVSPRSLTSFILPRIEEVSDTRSWIPLFQAAKACPIEGLILKMTNVQAIGLYSAQNVPPKFETMEGIRTSGQDGWNNTRYSQFSLKQPQGNCNLNGRRPNVIQKLESLNYKPYLNQYCFI